MKNYFFTILLALISVGAIVFFFFYFSSSQGEDTIQIRPSIVKSKPIIPYKYTEPNESLTLLFTGDIMLDRYMGKTIKKRGYSHVIGKEITDFFIKHLFVIINNEGVLSGKNPNPATPNMVQFTFADSSTEFFTSLGVTHANLGNNHSRDFGIDGDTRTREKLQDSKIIPYGSAFNDPVSTFTDFEYNGLKISLGSYNDIFPENFDAFLQKIVQEEKKSDLLIVTTHWGVEYYSGIEKKQQEKAYQIIDAGADIIVGNHPHVVAPIEQYKDGIIFYSLGNFIFDQVFSEGVKTGILLSISITPKETLFRLVPTKISDNFVVSVLRAEEKKIFLRAVSKVSKLPIETYGEIEQGVIHWRGFGKK